MTMVRGGEERDLAAIVAMGRVRADPFRFHLDRDIDLVQYAITRKRLLAGLGSADARQLHFFIAEEGTTAAAYVVVSVAGRTWTLEECGDRDASGARVGALLQALIAREPVGAPSDDPRMAAAALPAAAGHHRLGGAVDGDHDGADARRSPDAAAAVRRRCAVLAQRRLLTCLDSGDSG